MTFMDEFTHTSTLQFHPDRSKEDGAKPFGSQITKSN
jgi:hypothetical protein